MLFIFSMGHMYTVYFVLRMSYLAIVTLRWDAFLSYFLHFPKHEHPGKAAKIQWMR